MTHEEALMERGNQLARACAIARIRSNQLGSVLAHLKRHRDPKGTAQMLEALARSEFARRTRSSQEQFEGLRDQVGPALQRTRSWQDAALIVGWAQRLMGVHEMERRGSRGRSF